MVRLEDGTSQKGKISTMVYPFHLFWDMCMNVFVAGFEGSGASVRRRVIADFDPSTSREKGRATRQGGLAEEGG